MRHVRLAALAAVLTLCALPAWAGSYLGVFNYDALPPSPNGGDFAWVTNAQAPGTDPSGWSCTSTGASAATVLCTWDSVTSAWIPLQKRAAGAAGPPPVATACASPSIPNWQVARFPSATSVTVDVYQIDSSTQVADDAATTRVQLDSANSDLFLFDLATVTGYPNDCSRKTYLLRYAPDAADCTNNPGTCAVDAVVVNGL
jgi:hypothetical protein